MSTVRYIRPQGIRVTVMEQTIRDAGYGPQAAHAHTVLWRKLAVLGVILVLLQSALYTHIHLKKSTKHPVNANITLRIQNGSYNSSTHVTIRPHRRILLWTKWFISKEWFFGGLGHEPFIKRGCEEQWCVLTTDRSQFQTSALVLFHVRQLERGVASLPATHPPHQRWVFMSRESPAHTFLPHAGSLVPLDHKFNLTMTYSKRSDIYFGYGQYVNLSQPSGVLQRNYAAGKDRLTVWYVSNCENSPRKRLVTALSRHLKVDILGKCGKPDPCKRNKLCTRQLLSHYKFYLALENSLCREYTSEKLWNALDNDVVPVVLGADVQDYVKVTPPDSFIHVENFTSVKELADYLKYLNADEEAYNAYFKWKGQYTIMDKELIQSRALCRLCKIAHEDMDIRKSYTISQFWSRGNSCRWQIHYRKS